MKQKALKLLALDKLTDSEAAWLNHATREQAYPGLKERWEATGTTTPILTPDYCWSVNDCLMLELPADTELILYPSRNLVEVHITGGFLMGGITTFEARTLPLAILKAWWAIQPD